jgi:hypothetical protein
MKHNYVAWAREGHSHETLLTFNIILIEVNALLTSLMEDSRCASIFHIKAIARNTTPCFLTQNT